MSCFRTDSAEIVLSYFQMLLGGRGVERRVLPNKGAEAQQKRTAYACDPLPIACICCSLTTCTSMHILIYVMCLAGHLYLFKFLCVHQESAKGAGGKGARVINCHNFFSTPDRETRRIDHTTTEGTAERKMRQFATPAPFTPAPFRPF